MRAKALAVEPQEGAAGAQVLASQLTAPILVLTLSNGRDSSSACFWILVHIH